MGADVKNRRTNTYHLDFYKKRGKKDPISEKATRNEVAIHPKSEVDIPPKSEVLTNYIKPDYYNPTSGTSGNNNSSSVGSG